jgi:hypothetical protein
VNARKPARNDAEPIPATIAGLWERFPLAPLKTKASYTKAAALAARMAVQKMNPAQRAYHSELFTLIDAYEQKHKETDKTLARLQALARTLPDPHTIEGTPPNDAPPIRYPEYPGTPLRPEQFPTIDQAAQVSAVLAQGKPLQSERDAAALAESALRLWTASRDQINKERERARDYWRPQDTMQAAKVGSQARTQERLAKLGASDLLEQATVTWDEAAALLWKDAPPQEQDANLTTIAASMAGSSYWQEWTLESFRKFGFLNPLGFPMLIDLFDTRERKREKEALSRKMSEKGKASAAARKA